jgi:hypothetical protein
VAGWIVLSMVGDSGWGVAPEFIAEFFIIREEERPQSAAAPRETRASATSR